MGKVRRSTLFGLTFLLLFVAGCKVSCTTANISSLKFSKDKEGNTQTKDFAPGDPIYATATISNNPSKVTMKFSLIMEKVEGQPENTPVTNADASYDLGGSGYGLYTLTPPPTGWPAGRYRIEVAMLVDGEQKDKKADTFTITGSSSSGGTTPGPATTASPHDEATPEGDDANDSENSSPHGEH